MKYSHSVKTETKSRLQFKGVESQPHSITPLPIFFFFQRAIEESRFGEWKILGVAPRGNDPLNFFVSPIRGQCAKASPSTLTTAQIVGMGVVGWCRPAIARGRYSQGPL